MAEEKKQAVATAVPAVDISAKDLVPYIQRKGEMLLQEVVEARVKYGPRYNTRNNVEQMSTRFGNPKYDAEKFAKEYMLIIQEKSNLPASVRYVVRDLCDEAFNECYQDKVKLVCH